MKSMDDLLVSVEGQKVEVEKELLLRAYATLATGSFVPSMFNEVRNLMINFDALLGASDEDKSANRNIGDGQEG